MYTKREIRGRVAALPVFAFTLVVAWGAVRSSAVEPDRAGTSPLPGGSAVAAGAVRDDAALRETSTPAVTPRVVGYELHEPAGDRLAASAQGVGVVAAQTLVVLSDQELARGRTSGTSGIAGLEAIVYENIIDRGIVTVAGQRFNFAAQSSDGATNDLGFSLGIGTFVADDMFFDQGFGVAWRLGDQISSFSAFVRRSDDDETRFIGDGTTRATLTLWDGDPTRAIDTARRGYSGAPIAGASCDFTLSPDVGVGTLQKLRCNMANPITPPHDGGLDGAYRR